MEICRNCKFNSENSLSAPGFIRKPEHCMECGCILSAKTKCLSCACPIGKWEALISEADEKPIDEKLE